ncbi:hypothetical protein GJ744_011503 [Endocarpon pusillum]|uniref:Amine oxidase n=1 Tax=Endocarpon pusillum TaxID=364733 RepID=A0A8H7AFW8_9EURO|nr:hypothetical protein GJ744_011503 [Endocarpon pusillum]
MAIPAVTEQLNGSKIDIARQVVTKARSGHLLLFRDIFAEEPAKAELVPFLEAEHSGQLTEETSRPPRLARVQYDKIGDDGSHAYTESVVDVTAQHEVLHRVVEKDVQPPLTFAEFKRFQDACIASPMWKEAIEQFELPDGFAVCIDPWPYGGPDPGETIPRYTQGLCFARDTRKGEHSNHYGYPLPIIPVMDTHSSKLVRIDKLATGGTEDALEYNTHPKNVLDHCTSAEYVPELLSIDLRKDLKPLNVVQPEGPSFKVTDESLIEWQKWRFRIGFNPREGATLHDIHYDGRSIMYRLSLSEMTVPYGDPRPPFHRKQAFDFGDGGAGRAANNLSLGCDCLGVIKYFDAVVADTEGKPSVSKNVVCLHEQDAGIGWKHTNFRNNRAVVTRSRELVVQFVVTLANYEYVFAYRFDQAAGLTVETRATGIVSVVHIDKNKTSPWGNVVSPGTLAQNHQHLFALRLDPAIDGHRNTIFKEETLPLPMSPSANPHGNGYRVVSEPITTSSFLDASPFTNLTIKLSNPHILNSISRKPISYQFTPSPSQLLLADPKSTQAARARFATHHVWITKYRDGELFAAGEFTNQSYSERGGVADAVARNDDVGDADVVVWNVFGLTHNPRVEDWPVMPVEKHELHIRPADFFERNPALDVPGQMNEASVSVDGDGGKKEDADCCNGEGGKVQESAETHWQGTRDVVPNRVVNGDRNGDGNGVNGH